MKKLLVPVSLALLLIIAMAGTVLAAPKANGPQLPLKGTLESQETYVVNPPIMSVTASGSGNATQLGRYSINYQFQVNLETVAGVGSAQFIAANGDRLYAEGTGQATPTDIPGIFNIIENFTITGGTGRFAGASGSVTLIRVVDTNTGVTSGTIDGYILLA